MLDRSLVLPGVLDKVAALQHRQPQLPDAGNALVLIAYAPGHELGVELRPVQSHTKVVKPENC